MAAPIRPKQGSREQRRRADIRRGWIYIALGFIVTVAGAVNTAVSVFADGHISFTDVLPIVAGLITMFVGRSLWRRWRKGLGTASVLRIVLLLGLYGVSLAAATLYFAIKTINEDLPQDLTKLLEYQPYRKSIVLSSDGEEIGAFSIENRRIIQLERMPPHVPAAFLSAEDRRFYKHPGFDLAGIVRAAWKNFRSTGIKQGGSTITQQIIKQTLLADEEGDLSEVGFTPQQLAANKKTQKYKRKMKEVILAYRLERELTKAQILSIYLNHVYLGHGAYGVGAAAETYFGKEVEDLTIAEAAMLAGLVASPTKYAPHRNMQLARERQRYVLGHMREDQYISDAEYNQALAEPIALVDEGDLNHLASPYFVEHVRKLATKRYGNTELFKGGLRFYSTLDMTMQAAAESALKKGLESLDRRLGFRGPIGNVATKNRGAWTGGPAHPLSGGTDDTSALADQLLPEQRYGAMIVELTKKGGVIVDLGPKRLPLDDKDAKDVLAWHPKKKDNTIDYDKRIQLGDLLAVRLNAEGTGATIAQRPALQGSLVAMEPSTGRVVALVGGYDWTASQFDRATQAHRQVGSSIKPFIYSSAIEAGKTPVDTMYDGPFAVQTATGTWMPANYDNKYMGNVTLMTALAYSLNTISVQIATQVGLDRIIEILRGFGITSDIPRHISISLGTPDITPIEIATGYAGIANGGRRVTPRFFDLVTSTGGTVVEDLRNPPPGPQVISPEVAYVVINMMKGVVSRGTAKYATTIGRPTAGKTGTSANYKDVWFTGFTTDLLCSVWIGRDDSTPIGDKITGGGVAVPIWVDFMTKAHPRTKVRDFPPPPNVTFARVEPWSGDPASPHTDGSSVWMPFVRGTLPYRFLASLPVRAFDDLTPTPTVPRPAKCNSLDCL
ncbi:MAG TPA: PBP1A family penicillin-binding protein [Kofleriaceae bacterium]|nr:PBP1A family penicillin-binding protein [Kofleriaceae bacterium]